MRSTSQKIHWLVMIAIGCPALAAGLAMADTPEAEIRSADSSALPAATALGRAPGLVSSASPSLVFSTYLAGGNEDTARGVAIDLAGRTHVVGSTLSSDFPVVGGTGNPENDPVGPMQDAFLVHLEPEGDLTFSTYGTDAENHDFASDLDLGPSGEDWTSGIRYNRSSSNFDLFLALDLEILYEAGGEGYDVAKAVALAPDGSLRLTGHTCSRFVFGIDRGPLGPGPLACEGFLLLWRAGEAQVTLLGPVIPEDVAVDEAGNAYLAGSVRFGPPTYDQDAWVAKIDDSGSTLFSRQLGGSSFDEGKSIAVDAAGSAYVTGRTSSKDFPIRGGVQSHLAGEHEDIFVTKLGPTGDLMYSTYLGGQRDDYVESIAVDPAGRVALTGSTHSPDFPLKNPLQESRDGDSDVFVTVLDPSGSEVIFSTFLGGSSVEVGHAIDLDSQGRLAVAGLTYSSDFPTVNAAQPSFGGNLGTTDAFVAKIELSGNRPPDCSGASASPSVIWPPNGRMVPVSIRGVTDPDGDVVSISILGVRQDEPLTRRGAEDARVNASTVQVRSSRAGGGDGRIYHLTFQATDPQGASCTGTVTSCVPHDRGQASACGDGGALFDSTAGG